MILSAEPPTLKTVVMKIRPRSCMDVFFHGQ